MVLFVTGCCAFIPWYGGATTDAFDDLVSMLIFCLTVGIHSCPLLFWPAGWACRLPHGTFLLVGAHLTTPFYERLVVRSGLGGVAVQALHSCQEGVQRRWCYSDPCCFLILLSVPMQCVRHLCAICDLFSDWWWGGDLVVWFDPAVELLFPFLVVNLLTLMTPLLLLIVSVCCSDLYWLVTDIVPYGILYSLQVLMHSVDPVEGVVLLMIVLLMSVVHCCCAVEENLTGACCWWWRWHSTLLTVPQLFCDAVALHSVPIADDIHHYITLLTWWVISLECRCDAVPHPLRWRLWSPFPFRRRVFILEVWPAPFPDAVPFPSERSTHLLGWLEHYWYIGKACYSDGVMVTGRWWTGIWNLLLWRWVLENFLDTVFTSVILFWHCYLLLLVFDYVPGRHYSIYIYSIHLLEILFDITIPTVIRWCWLEVTWFCWWSDCVVIPIATLILRYCCCCRWKYSVGSLLHCYWWCYLINAEEKTLFSVLCVCDIPVILTISNSQEADQRLHCASFSDVQCVEILSCRTSQRLVPLDGNSWRISILLTWCLLLFCWLWSYLLLIRCHALGGWRWPRC